MTKIDIYNRLRVHAAWANRDCRLGDQEAFDLAADEIDRLTAERDQEREEHTDTLELLDKAQRERDTALAQVAAAFGAAERALEARKYGDPDEREEYAFDAALDRGIVAIRKLTPDAARAALSRMLDEAYAAGQERMREAAAKAAYQWWDDDDAQELRQHIRALPITPRPDREDLT